MRLAFRTELRLTHPSCNHWLRFGTHMCNHLLHIIRPEEAPAVPLPDRIQRDILIQAPIDIVWAVLTQPEHIARWFSDAAEVDLRPGGSGLFTFTERATTQPVAAPIQVETVDPPHTFAYRWGHAGGTQAHAGNSALVEFTLAAEGDATRLRVVESGLLDMGLSAADRATYVTDHTHGWEVHLASARDYMRAHAPLR